MTKSKILGATLALCTVFSMSAEAKLYKWVDDNGETHYGEVIPPEYANRDKVQIDGKGRVIKDKSTPSVGIDSKAAIEQKALMDQRRKDSALLNTYSNAKEIDLARDRNLQQVEAKINSIQTMLKSAQESLDGFHKEAGALKAGKPIPASLQADITEGENRVSRLKQELDEANAKAASVKSSFEADRARYLELTTGSTK